MNDINLDFMDAIDLFVDSALYFVGIAFRSIAFAFLLVIFFLVVAIIGGVAIGLCSFFI